MAWLLNPSMLEFLILAAIACAGYAGGSGWLALAGAVALTVGGWWRKVQLMRQDPQVPFSSKMTTYLDRQRRHQSGLRRREPRSPDAPRDSCSADDHGYLPVNGFFQPPGCVRSGKAAAR